MKVFISHKSDDSYWAEMIAKEFQKEGVECYLDILDTCITGGGKELTDHIKKNLNSCTDIIVLMSSNTKKSWWVPFEIGMSAQVDMPTATFLRTYDELPDYLTYWPRLRYLSEIHLYVQTRNRVHTAMRYDDKYIYAENKKAYETRAFYDALKKELR